MKCACVSDRYLDGNTLDSSVLPSGLFANLPLLQTIKLDDMGLLSLESELFSGLGNLDSLYA